jgi:putative restriction endonuclease
MANIVNICNRVFELYKIEEVNLVDSFVHSNNKLKSTSGVGEKRLYLGHDKLRLDSFVNFSDSGYFFTSPDLKKYLLNAKLEFKFPAQSYENNISSYYNDYLSLAQSLPNFNFFDFSITYDNQGRYYLVDTIRGSKSSTFKKIPQVCLPRCSRMFLIQARDINSGKKYIYVKPIFNNNYLNIYNHPSITAPSPIAVSNSSSKSRVGQQKWKEEIRLDSPFCPITKASDIRWLDAAHIKPFSECVDAEEFDVKNGFLITPTFHRLFDNGYISFQDNTLLLSSVFPSIEAKCLGISNKMKVKITADGRENYFEWHRDTVFNS